MNRNFRGIGIYILVLLVLWFAISNIPSNTQRIPEIDSSELIKKIEAGEVKKIHQVDTELTVELKSGEKVVNYLPLSMFSSFYGDYLKEWVDAGEMIVSSEKPASAPWYSELLTTVLMVAGFGLIWFFLMQQMQGSNNKAMSFGKSRAKLHKDDNLVNITFKDVAGLEEEKEELEEIVDFLKSPKKYNDLGARIPTGVLMVGPPGTGKTYLSKAVAGEAGVPFFSISGSDFVEMFVGVGASRVRDLFETAKKQAPAIVFIDEIDAVGRRRGAGVGGGHDEREQTLNQLLVEMDGFSKNEGIIVMAATNRADILDPAILRPGRFDRTIYVGPPDVKGREAILKVHTRNKPLADDVDLKVIAKRTPGFTPADLENLVNEAALLSARFNQKRINMNNITEASLKVQMGPAKKSKVVTEADRRLTAVHEAGHAIVSKLTPDSDPVHMITIIPRGMAGGFTAYLPTEEHSFVTKSQLNNQIISLMGGRAAEEVVLNEISTGASNDIERATAIARAMVVSYGMSEELGTINYGEEEHQVFMGRDFGRNRGYSEEVAAKIDGVIHNIIDHGYSKAKDIINSNMDILNRVVDALLEKETLNAEEFEMIFRGEVLETV